MKRTKNLVEEDWERISDREKLLIQMEKEQIEWQLMQEEEEAKIIIGQTINKEVDENNTVQLKLKKVQGTEVNGDITRCDLPF